jgi:hypothetical protein
MHQLKRRNFSKDGFHVLSYYSIEPSGVWLPPLWSSGQSSWLQIRRPGFDFRHYQKQNVVGLERGPLSLVNTTEELLDRKVAATGENTAVGIRHADHVAPSNSKKLAITSPTSGGRSVGVFRSRTQTMEFVYLFVCLMNLNLGFLNLAVHTTASLDVWQLSEG